jgi:hypothetical protein
MRATEAEVEAQARKMWDEREQGFPVHVRQRWEDGSAMARCYALADAEEALRAATHP